MISAIVVTHNSREFIGRCLDSLQTGIPEVVVVDNASGDGTADFVQERYPVVKLIRCRSNTGFATAANLGARHSAGTALLFLNPDTVCLGPLKPLEQVLERSERIAAVAPRLVDERGETQVGFNVRRLPTATSLIFEILLLNQLFPRNPVNRKFRCLDLDHSKPAEVEQPAGACLLVRRSAWERCGGFDEGFFPLWFEDVDLGLRLRRAGGTILFWPDVRVQHCGGHSVESLNISQKQIYWYRNLLYYVRKHFPRRVHWMIRGTLIGGMVLRIFAETLAWLTRGEPQFGVPPCRPRPSHREAVRAYWEAAKLGFGGGGGVPRSAGDFPPGWSRSVKRG